ncbi:hypothetical protein CERSUDRAFT_100294 [Gelatoporia subvermispora B]|uniref:Uncharacterized protein n=1 Tax=Ceriporiopsis subvermispora (strain B) TaxID=914234 RepID=M2QHR4_CERS8|nr:hypothetical protein CERSUDRAFT_100294 [Gelatoporia subvermispora B]
MRLGSPLKPLRRMGLDEADKTPTQSAVNKARNAGTPSDRSYTSTQPRSPLSDEMEGVSEGEIIRHASGLVEDQDARVWTKVLKAKKDLKAKQDSKTNQDSEANQDSKANQKSKADQKAKKDPKFTLADLPQPLQRYWKTHFVPTFIAWTGGRNIWEFPLEVKREICQQVYNMICGRSHPMRISVTGSVLFCMKSRLDQYKHTVSVEAELAIDMGFEKNAAMYETMESRRIFAMNELGPPTRFLYCTSVGPDQKDFRGCFMTDAILQTFGVFVFLTRPAMKLRGTEGPPVGALALAATAVCRALERYRERRVRYKTDKNGNYVLDNRHNKLTETMPAPPASGASDNIVDFHFSSPNYESVYHDIEPYARRIKDEKWNQILELSRTLYHSSNRTFRRCRPIRRLQPGLGQQLIPHADDE